MTTYHFGTTVSALNLVEAPETRVPGTNVPDRPGAGHTLKVRDTLTGAALPDATVGEFGHWTITTEDIAFIDVSADGGSTWVMQVPAEVFTQAAEVLTNVSSNLTVFNAALAEANTRLAETTQQALLDRIAEAEAAVAAQGYDLVTVYDRDLGEIVPGGASKPPWRAPTDLTVTPDQMWVAMDSPGTTATKVNVGYTPAEGGAMVRLWNTDLSVPAGTAEWSPTTAPDHSVIPKGARLVTMLGDTVAPAPVAGAGAAAYVSGSAVAIGEGATTTASTQTFTLATGGQAGDLLIFQISAAAENIALPAGWTRLAFKRTATSKLHTAIYAIEWVGSGPGATVQVVTTSADATPKTIVPNASSFILRNVSISDVGTFEWLDYENNYALPPTMALPRPALTHAASLVLRGAAYAALNALDGYTWDLTSGPTVTTIAKTKTNRSAATTPTDYGNSVFLETVTLAAGAQPAAATVTMAGGTGMTAGNVNGVSGIGWTWAVKSGGGAPGPTLISVQLSPSRAPL